MTTQANLYVDQGTDYTIDLVLTTNSGESYPTLNRSFFCSIKKLYSSVASANAEVTSLDSANNTISLYISPEITTDLDPGKYTYDVVMVMDSGSKSKILEGLMFIISTNTRV